MKIISWNVNGMRSILGKGFGEFLAASDADILCLQETKARPEQMEGEWHPGYSAIWNPAERPGYSGTLILTRVPVEGIRLGIGETVGDAEGRVISVELESFHLVNVYTPNARGDLSRLAYRTEVWDPAFRRHCMGLEETKPVIFCGDLNVAHEPIDLANPKSNRGKAGFTDEERREFSAHLEAGYLDTFRLFNREAGQYSWWSYRAGARARNVGWRIDYVCASTALRERLDKAFILQQVPGSDHCPVGIEIA